MQETKTTSDLNRSIQQLEHKQANEWLLLKANFFQTYESLKPVNLIKNTITELVKAPDLKEDIVNTTFSLAVGYLSKKAIVGTTENPIKKLMGTLLQIGVTNIISKNAESIKSVGRIVFNKILNTKTAE